MKSFKNFLSEEVVLSATVRKNLVDIDNPAVRDHINQVLGQVVSGVSLTPYNALEKVRKALAYYHIELGPTPFLEGSMGSRTWAVEQFGNIVGMNDRGEVVTKNPSSLSIQFSWQSSNGYTHTVCKIVTPDELNEGILSGMQHATGAKTKWGGAAATAATIAATAGLGAVVWPAHPVVGAGIAGAYALRKIIQRARAKKPDLVEARLTPSERRAILDARRMEAAMQGRNPKLPRIKVSSPKELKATVKNAEKIHFLMGSHMRSNAKQQAAKQTQVNSKPFTSRAPVPVDISKHEYKVVNPTPTKRYIPMPDVKSEFDKHIDAYNKTGKRAYLSAAERAAHAHYASNYSEYPEDAQKILNDRMHVLGTIRQSNPGLLGKVKKMIGLKETITDKTPAKSVIHDFVHSKNKMFKGDSKKERIKRALGAYYSKHES